MRPYRAAARFLIRRRQATITTKRSWSIRPVEIGGHVSTGRIHLTVNGVTKQDADIADLIWDCAETIAYISRFERLLPGDLIYTGTPAGVGPVQPGDVIDVAIAGLEPLRVTIGPIDAAFRI